MSGLSGKLQRRIHRACRPTLDEPNIPLNLEICDLINQKQGNLPREAAVGVVRMINSRDPQVAELAITLLDYLVKNCGYPIHLQISRKEFLNELVKRFPERPPPAYTRVQRLILGEIAEWVQTICRTSRYKEDLGYIRDMYRLLRSKGYEFPAVKSEDAAVLNPSDNLKSIDELQQEEKRAQSAKLQELIRRGRPQDLRKANDLMKIMSGFKEDESFEQTKQTVKEEVEKVGRKADLLDEMLNNATNSGRIDSSDDTLQELITSVRVARPKLQKIIQEESNDQPTVQKLLALNDKLNAVLKKVDLLTGGDTAAAAQVDVPGSPTGAVDLIDFDDDDNDGDANATMTANVDVNPSAKQSSNPSGNDTMADLLSDLSGLSFGTSQKPQSTSKAPASSALDLLDAFQPKATNPTAKTASKPIAEPAIQPLVATAASPLSSPLSPPAASARSSFTALRPEQPFEQSSTLKVGYTIDSRDQSSVTMTLHYSNVSLTKNVTNLRFSLAVTKKFGLELQQPSGSSLRAGVSDGITQSATIRQKEGAEFSSLKLKYLCTYQAGSDPAKDEGVVTITV